MLANTQGGLIAGVGIVLLLWSIIKLLSSIEDSFNEIWEIKRDRTWTRKITDYLSIMLIGPIFIILSFGLTNLYLSFVDDFSTKKGRLGLGSKSFVFIFLNFNFCLFSLFL